MIHRYRSLSVDGRLALQEVYEDATRLITYCLQQRNIKLE